MHLDFLNKVTLEDLERYFFLLSPWREKNVELKDRENYLLHAISKDLFILDFVQCLASHGIKEPIYEIKVKSESIGTKLVTDTVNFIALTLELQNFTRLQFCLNWNIDDICLQVFNTKCKIEQNEILFLIDQYLRFLDYSLKSRLFYILFNSPYNKNLIVSDRMSPLWLNYLWAFSILIKQFQNYFTDVSIFKFFRFWLTRLHQAGAWSSNLIDLKHISAQCAFYDDPENNRIFTHVDYFGSILGAQYLREYSSHIQFPVLSNNIIESRYQSIEHIDEQIYNRMSACMVAAQGSESGEILTGISTGTIFYDDSVVLKAFNFLKYFSSAHFMGQLGELFGLSLVNSRYNLNSSEIVCIPGSSILIRTKKGAKQGPDGLLASVAFDNNQFIITIHAVIEVKSFRISKNKLASQLYNHLKRLKEGTVELIYNEGDDCIKYFAPKIGIGKNCYKSSLVKKIEFSDKVEYIGVIPSSARKIYPSPVALIEMPWFPTGFRLMGYSFMCWVIVNLGRVGNGGDYQKGKYSWIKRLELLLKNEKVNYRDKRSVEAFLDILKNGINNPDNYWVPLN